MPSDFSDLESRLTETARASFERAGLIAKDQGSPYIGTEHILLGVLAQNSSLGAKILADSGVTLDRTELVLGLTTKELSVAATHHGISKEVMEAVRIAWQLASEFGQSHIGTEHIVYSILVQRDARATKLLRDMNVDIESLRNSLENIFDKQQFESMQESIVEERRRHSGRSDLKILDKFGIDLTRRAKAGELDPVVGRDKETSRLITIIGRRSKNNPALIGEPGVGKTAVVEGLARRIADGDVPSFLLGRRIIQLDLASMVAGTKFRGQFEERIKKVLDIAKKHQEIILFVDELHLLVGTGMTDGSMDAANMFKPALSRGEIRLIGATTFDEYRKYIEKDAALSRRFQAVTVNEPSEEVAVQMLTSVGERLAAYHKVAISPEIIKLSVELSQRYITERFLPDKAIDILDEAAALVSSRPRSMDRREKLARQIKRLAGKIDAAVESENYKAAAELKMQMEQLNQQISKLPQVVSLASKLTEDDLRQAVTAMTGIPMNRLAVSEMKQLAKLEAKLEKRIFGQKEAAAVLARAIRRGKSGLARHNGPIGSFIFLGPTGVGKTEMAKVLASELFGSDDNLIKIDMSEFGEKHTVSRLLGAPAGYIGYDDGGKLTDRIRRYPYSVVLFDEIEKAHPDILNLLLQLLEDGELTDSNGRTVSFRQTIVILTSNIGAEQMVQEDELGFGSIEKDDNARNEDNSRAARRELAGFLRPELISRFDAIITFNRLSRNILAKIFDRAAVDLAKAIERQGLKLKLTPGVKRFIVNRGVDEDSGARAIRRIIQDELVDAISDAVISGPKPGSLLMASMDKGEVKIHVIDS